MAFRDFRDESGAVWTVWDTYPQAAERRGMASLSSGWLTFEKGTERRRLVPAPIGWAEQPDDRLRHWLELSTSVRLRIDSTEAHADERAAPADPPRRRALDRERLVADSGAARDEIRDLIDRSRDTIEKVTRAMDRGGQAISEPGRRGDSDRRS